MKTYPEKRANKTWILSESIDTTSNEALLAYPPLARQLLFNRGVHDASQAELFLDPSDKLIGLYKSADAFVFPSHVESFGIAIIEAMAASLPVITTDGPGCRDVVGQGKYGIMVPVKDHERLAAAMNKLLSHKGLREKYTNISKKRALMFAWRSIVDQYLETYRTLIRRKVL